MNIYLDFDGDCRTAFEFYRSVFGGDFVVLQTFADGPEEMQVPAEALERIMHVSLPLGDAMLMGSDSLAGSELIVGNNFSIAVPVESRSEADEWFAGLARDGEVLMALQETFWGSYFGRVRDQFGITWMFNYGLENE